MKSWLTVSILMLSTLSCLVLNSRGEQRGGLSEFMRAKLKHSQNVLEGLVLNDLPKVEKGAQEMKWLSLETNWQVVQTARYVEFSRQFRADADALIEAARKNNLDKATTAFNHLVIRCVECHKYVRDVQMVPGGK